MIEERPIATSKEYISTIVWEDHFQIENIGCEPKRKMLAVVDSKVKWLWKKAGADISKIPVFYFDQPSENLKSFKTVQSVLKFLFKNEADRGSVLVAVGGGVTLDVAGFAASIFKRGIEWIAVPTTLLAQVDASVGGKTAINYPAGKNSIGTFYPPSKVIISPDCANTWTDVHKLEGRAEMFKIFVCFDHEAKDQLVADPNESTLTNRSIEIKAKVVDCDPWENHLRAALNYGHTIGHALELELGMAHGLSVALGIRIENAVANRMGIMKKRRMKQIESELDGLGFPIRSEWPAFENLLPYLRQDKKNVRGDIMLCLPDGETPWLIEPRDPRTKVSEEILKSVYESYISSTSRA